MNKLIKIVLIFLCILNVYAWSTIRYIIPSLNNIQTAINSARSGDTLILEDGTHINYNIIVPANKVIVLGSRFILDKDTNHISKTRVSGDHKGRIFNIASGPKDSKYIGFTVEDGRDSSDVAGPAFNCNGFGSIHLENMIIRNNVGLRRYSAIVIKDFSTVNIINTLIENNKGGTTYPSAIPVSWGFSSESGYANINIINSKILNHNVWLGALSIEGCKPRTVNITNSIIEGGNSYGIKTSCRGEININNSIVLGAAYISASIGQGYAPLIFNLNNSIVLGTWSVGQGAPFLNINHSVVNPVLHKDLIVTDTASMRGVDPLFIDTNSDNYRLASNSTLIDAGDPADSYANEPSCANTNKRIDIGAYGNTIEATCKSVGAHMAFNPSFFNNAVFKNEIRYDTLTITNTQAFPMYVRSCSDIYINDPNLVCTGISPENAPISQNEFVKIYLRFQATQQQLATIPIVVYFPADNAGTTVNYIISVENKDYDQLFANLWEFDSAQINTNVKKVFHLKNQGHNTLQISEFTMSSSAFSMDTPKSFTLLPSDSLPFTLTFTPPTAQIYQTRIVLKSPNINSIDSTLIVRGKGVDTNNLVGISKIPVKFGILKNSPNPFHTSTHLVIGLPYASQLDMSIFDLNGKRIKSLYNGFQQAGYHHFSWDGKDKNGHHIPSGVYYYNIYTPQNTITQKIIFAR